MSNRNGIVSIGVFAGLVVGGNHRLCFPLDRYRSSLHDSLKAAEPVEAWRSIARK